MLASRIQIIEILGFVRRRWFWPTLGVAVGVALAVLYCLKATELFQSSAQILVMQKDSRLPTQAEDAAAGAIDSRVADDLLATHMQLIASPRIVRIAFETGQLASLASISQTVPADEDPVRFIIDKLDVRRGGKGQAQTAHVLKPVITYPSAQDSAVILEAIVEAYQHFVNEKFRDVSSEAVGLIAKAKDDLLQTLHEKETRYQRFRERTPMLWSGNESVNVHQMRLIDIEKSLMENQLRYAQVKSRLETVQTALSQANSESLTDLERAALIDNADIGRLSLLISVNRRGPVSEAFRASQPVRAEAANTEHDRLLALRLSAKNLQLELGPNHPKVLETQQSIKEMEGFLANQASLLDTIAEGGDIDPTELMAAYSQLLGHDRLELEKRLEALEELAKKERSAAKELVTYELQGNSLRRDLERSQTLYDTVVDRLREINLIKDYGGFITEIISHAQPGESIWPNWKLLLAVGGLSGLLFGSVVGFGLECFDRSFHGLNDVQSTLQLPILVRVPNLRAATRAAARSVPKGTRVHASIVTLHRPATTEADVYRQLRTKICFHDSVDEPAVLQVASPRKSDGTTTLVANLGVSMALAGKRTLIVDCNFHRPQLHRSFGIESAPGLSTYLLDGGELGDVASAVSIANECLHVIPSGPVELNSSDLLSRTRFDEFIQAARKNYDIVLLDSPHVLSFSDSLAIAPRADAVLLQVRLTGRGRESAIRALGSLEEVGATVLGVTVR